MDRIAQLFAALIVLVCGVCLGSAGAQDAAPVDSVGAVKIELDRFGVGGISRLGDWFGVRLILTDSVDKPRNVIVQIASRDPDGDTAISERAIALNGTERMSVWMYHKLSFTRAELSFDVFEAEEGVVRDACGRDLPARGARIGTLQTADFESAGPSSKVVQSGVGLLGIVGTADFDLQKLSNQLAPTSPYLPFGHEMMEIARSLTPAEFPDRWHGLAAFDAIVWGSGEPSELRPDSRRALRDWIERGGHLVVVLPSAGQTWTNENLSDLYDAMPLVSVKRIDGVDLTVEKYLFTHRSGERMPKDATLHVLTPMADIKPSDATVILQDTENRPIVVRRAVGSGMITWIGVDLNQRTIERSIECDVFWSRIFGRRGSTLSEADLTSEQSADGNSVVSTSAIRAPSRLDVQFDAGILNLIALQRDSLQGLLIAFVLFVGYWIVAGPIGYSILKAKDLTRHAWMAFVISALVFTALAWGGASLFRSRSVQARHFAVLDHVYGQSVQRATMWSAVLIPRYGEVGISILPQFESERSGNSISAWSDSSDSGWISFPDARGYRTPINDRSRLAVPARQTIKNLQVEWAGGPPWPMPIPIAPPGSNSEAKIELLGDGRWQKDQPLISGVLKHDLPAPLRNVQVIVNKGQPPIRRNFQFSRRRDDPVFDAYIFTLQTDWQPDEELDLTELTRVAVLPDFTPWINGLRPPIVNLNIQEVPRDELMKRLRAITFFQHLPPPVDELNQTDAYAAQRHYTHRLDLSAWMTQPCVIILGEVGGENELAAQAPIGLAADGEDVKSRGCTLVRWVYPLPSRPTGFAQKYDPAKRETSAPNETPQSEPTEQESK